jgi:Carbohydrate-selective porin, OprB family
VGERGSILTRAAGWLAGAALIAATLPSRGLADQATNTAPAGVLLMDSLGRTVTVSTNAVKASLLPPPKVGLNSQVPTPPRGEPAPEDVLRRQETSREGKEPFTFFPPYQPRLMPYLATQDDFGNTAIKPGPLIGSTPFDVAAQQSKYWLSEAGFRYSLQQTVTWVSMEDVMHGENTLAFYTLSLQSKWAIYADPAGGTAAWISSHIGLKSGMDSGGQTQSARINLGSISDPTGIWTSANGIRVPELAWQQMFRDGELVVVAGIINQGNYLDANSYASSGRSQFLNSALINSMVIPLAAYNFGLNLQWQPTEEWYAMIGTSAGNAYPGVPPWTDFAWNSWSVVGEFGYAPKDVLGLGSGVYRIQPFVARQEGGETKKGGGLNFQQRLGSNSGFAWFGRLGFGGSELFRGELSAADTGAQAGTGLVVQDPTKYLRVLSNRANDAFGIGFIWSHPTSAAEPLLHQDEYALELGYRLQLTPTMRLHPDVQVVWNAVHNPDPGPVTVVQLQFEVGW